MNEQQRRSRAELIREDPVLWLLISYAATFLDASAAFDIWALFTGDATAGTTRYLLPFAIAFGAWRGLRSWAGNVLVGTSVTAAAEPLARQG
jgi:hypothetical protein